MARKNKSRMVKARVNVESEKRAIKSVLDNLVGAKIKAQLQEASGSGKGR